MMEEQQAVGCVIDEGLARQMLKELVGEVDSDAETPGLSVASRQHLMDALKSRHEVHGALPTGTVALHLDAANVPALEETLFDGAALSEEQSQTILHALKRSLG
jgi:hypothetical protein